ncbi:hypothetical protein ACOSP7_000437 [Xanthoceras sorbifolium]
MIQMRIWKLSVEAMEKMKRGDRKEKKQVTTNAEAAALLDQYLPDHIKAEYHVLEHVDEIYNAMLNQTNVGDNNNKFYEIQALESNDGGKFMVYSRWGRVEIKGQDKLQGTYPLRDLALR